MTTGAFVRAAVAALAVAYDAAAQPASAPSTFTSREGTVDLAVPESPAFAALGLTPDSVVRPTTARELATSLLNGIDRDGNLQTGVAVDFAPYLLAAGSRLTLTKYQARDQAFTRFLARMQWSFASTKGAADKDPAARLSVGSRFTLFDQGDPRMDGELLTCLGREASKALAAAPPIPPGASPSEQAVELSRREEQVRQAVKPCRTAAAKRRWNRAAWIAGVAPTWTSAAGSASELAYSGTALWTSLAYGFEGVPVLEDQAVFALYAKRRTGELAPDRLNDGSFVKQNHVSVGARLLAGSSSSQLSAETLWVGNDRADGLEDRFWNLAVGFEQRLADNTWLSVTVGRQVGRDAGADALSVSSAFNWAVGPRK